MDYSKILFLAAAAVLVIWLMVRRNRSDRKAFFAEQRRTWGAVPKAGRTDEEIRLLRTYAEREEEENSSSFSLDALTWNDGEMNSLFRRMDGCVSDPGREVLLDWLTHPLPEEETYRRRRALIRAFSEQERLRDAAAEALAGLREKKCTSFYADMRELDGAQELSAAPFVLLAGLTVLSVVLLFFVPVPAIVLLLAVLIADFSVRIRIRGTTGRQLAGISRILALIRCGKKLAKACLPELTEEYKRCTEGLAGFARGAFVVSGSGSYDTGFSAAVLEYVKLLFHVDLIKFNQMLGIFRKKRSLVLRLFRAVGEADAALACASFRESLPFSCEPEFQEQADALCAEDLFHPLLADPVPNGGTFRGGHLITGSNASGKSTFLRSLLAGAVLAQTAGIAPAARWAGPRFRICSSMSVRDSLTGGESYFMAEIRAVKRMLLASEEQEPSLLLIDELLRGTNTAERIAASAGILQYLQRGRTLLFCATHDLELTTLAGPKIRNLHFQEDLEDGDVRFRYRLLEGPSDTTNAIALLRADGFPREITEEAERLAGELVKGGTAR